MKYVIRCVVALCVALNCVASALAGENPAGRTTTGDVGDVLQVAIPLVGVATAVAREDWQGVRQFGAGLASTVAFSYVLKTSVNKTRPDGRDRDSFPSSHTAASIHAAAFVHERYGWRWAVPLYTAAAFVGHSRIHDERHDAEDVIAGAIIGYVAARYFTTSYKGVQVQATVAPEFIGLRFSIR